MRRCKKYHANGDEPVKIDTEVELQYGGCPFAETGSSSNSAVDWNISKFGLQLDFDVPIRVPSQKPKLEVDFRLHSAILRKSI